MYLFDTHLPDAPFAWTSAALIGAGLAVGATADTGSARIAVMHTPAACISFTLYAAMAGVAALALARRDRVAALFANAIAPTGIVFTLLALWTEALLRKPVHGLWWVWDAHAVAQLMLMFLFGGVLALRSMIDDPRRADRATALLALVGAGNLPVVYFSIHWWDALRLDGATAAAPELAGRTLVAAALVFAGFVSYALFAVSKRARCTAAEYRVLAHSTIEFQEVKP
jgi:heme exporter protein C